MITCCVQVPIYELRNDGRDNLLGALLIAGQFVIPEVIIGFEMGIIFILNFILNFSTWSY